MRRRFDLVRRAISIAVPAVVIALAAACAQTDSSRPGQVDRTDRSVLPIAEPQVQPISQVDARQATAPARFEVKAPKGAPNVVIVLIDDIGFGHASTFGGPCQTPTRENTRIRELRPRLHDALVDAINR